MDREAWQATVLGLLLLASMCFSRVLSLIRDLCPQPWGPECGIIPGDLSVEMGAN